MIIEIEFDSLAEARAMGPQAILDRCVRDGLRLLESPTYCERDGRGVLSVEAAELPSIVVNVSTLVSDDSIAAAVVRALEHNQPAASVAAQPEIDQ